MFADDEYLYGDDSVNGVGNDAIATSQGKEVKFEFNHNEIFTEIKKMLENHKPKLLSGNIIIMDGETLYESDNWDDFTKLFPGMNDEKARSAVLQKVIRAAYDNIISPNNAKRPVFESWFDSKRVTWTPNKIQCFEKLIAQYQVMFQNGMDQIDLTRLNVKVPLYFFYSKSLAEKEESFDAATVATYVKVKQDTIFNSIFKNELIETFKNLGLNPSEQQKNIQNFLSQVLLSLSKVDHPMQNSQESLRIFLNSLDNQTQNLSNSEKSILVKKIQLAWGEAREIVINSAVENTTSAELAKRNEEVKALKAEIVEKDKLCADLEAKVQVITGEKDEAVKEKVEAVKNEDRNYQNIKRLQEDIARLQGKVDEQAETIEKVKEAVQNRSNEVTTLRTQKAEIAKNNIATHQELNALRTKFDEDLKTQVAAQVGVEAGVAESKQSEKDALVLRDKAHERSAAILKDYDALKEEFTPIETALASKTQELAGVKAVVEASRPSNVANVARHILTGALALLSLAAVTAAVAPFPPAWPIAALCAKFLVPLVGLAVVSAIGAGVNAYSQYKSNQAYKKLEGAFYKSEMQPESPPPAPEQLSPGSKMDSLN